MEDGIVESSHQRRQPSQRRLHIHTHTHTSPRSCRIHTHNAHLAPATHHVGPTCPVNPARSTGDDRQTVNGQEKKKAFLIAILESVLE